MHNHSTTHKHHRCEYWSSRPLVSFPSISSSLSPKCCRSSFKRYVAAVVPANVSVVYVCFWQSWHLEMLFLAPKVRGCCCPAIIGLFFSSDSRLYTYRYYVHTYIHTCIRSFLGDTIPHQGHGVCEESKGLMYIRTYMHTYIHTYIHTHHTCIHTCSSCMHTCIHTYIHTYAASFLVHCSQRQRRHAWCAQSSFDRPAQNWQHVCAQAVTLHE